MAPEATDLYWDIWRAHAPIEAQTALQEAHTALHAGRTKGTSWALPLHLPYGVDSGAQRPRLVPRGSPYALLHLLAEYLPTWYPDLVGANAASGQRLHRLTVGVSREEWTDQNFVAYWHLFWRGRTQEYTAMYALSEIPTDNGLTQRLYTAYAMKASPPGVSWSTRTVSHATIWRQIAALGGVNSPLDALLHRHAPHMFPASP